MIEQLFSKDLKRAIKQYPKSFYCGTLQKYWRQIWKAYEQLHPLDSIQCKDSFEILQIDILPKMLRHGQPTPRFPSRLFGDVWYVRAHSMACCAMVTPHDFAHIGCALAYIATPPTTLVDFIYPAGEKCGICSCSSSRSQILHSCIPHAQLAITKVSRTSPSAS